MSSIMLAFLTILIAFLAPAVSQEQTDQGWGLRVTNMEQQPRICFDAPKIPRSAKGAYFIAGPSKFDGHPAGRWEYQAIFDGFGMVNRFEIHPSDQPGKLCYTSAWMNTGLYQEFLKNPAEPPRGVLFQDTIPSRKTCTLGMCDYKAPNDNNWVNSMPIGNELVWFSDTPEMVKMDPISLNCTGLKTWKDDKLSMGTLQPSWVLPEHIAMGGSAHPLPIPGTSKYVELIAEHPLIMGHNYMAIYTFDSSVSTDQDRKLITRVKEYKTMYIHSFGVTANHVVLPMNLQSMGLGPGHKPFIIGTFSEEWKGMYVVNIHDGSTQVFDDMDPFFHVHITNTYENASGIVLELGAYDKVPFSLDVINIGYQMNKTRRDSKDLALRSQVRRFHLNNITGKTTVENLTEAVFDYDFLKINNDFSGLPHCFYYAVEWYHDRKNYASMAILKHDVCKGEKLYWSRANVYVNEPWFIPSGDGGAEDDGTLIFTANDGNTGKAIFVALDGRTFTEIENVALPTHLSFQAHGHFMPATEDTVIV